MTDAMELITWMKSLKGHGYGFAGEAVTLIESLQADNELMRKTLETIAGCAADQLQATQARGALANIGPPPEEVGGQR